MDKEIKVLSSRVERLKRMAMERVEDVNLDRARLVTESYRQTEGEPVVLRRAKALAHFFLNFPVRIWDDELIVGDRSWVRPYWWNCPDMNPKNRPTSTDPELDAQLLEIWSYWLRDEVIAPTTTSIHRHCVPGFKKLLEQGFEGIAEHAMLRLRSAQGRKLHQVRNSKSTFWRAAALLADACAQVGRRYAAFAREMATHADEERRRELLEMAQVCEQVPAKPARTFREALQSLWFGQLLIEAEDCPDAHCPGRIDQLLYPYYQRDTAEGRLTREEAKELLACYWLKMWAPYDVHDTIIGGITPDGGDAVNDLSYLILEVQQECGLYRQLSVRYHRNMTDDFLEKACDVVRQGLGVPQWFNDDVLVEGLVDMGIPREEANDYAIIGCVEMTIPGRADPRAVAHYGNLMKCLEYALTDGVCLMSGQQRGPQMGDLSGIKTFDDLVARYKRQVEWMLDEAVRAHIAAEQRQAETMPLIMLSLLTEDCIEKAKDITAGGAHFNWSMFCAVGIPNVADSLTALKKRVFEEQRVTLQEVVEAMKRNFEGCEPLRQMLLHTPKYGSDNDYADEIALEVATHYARTLSRYRNWRGGRLFPAFFSFTSCVHMGAQAGASPDGRRAGTPLANSLTPAQGHAAEGPSAAVRSAAKLNQRQAAAGTSFLLDLHPSLVHRTYTTDPLASLIRTYFALGGTHVEFTLVDEARLRAAQKEPDKYRDLTVRVAGYSAKFVELTPALQEHVIERMKTML